MWPALATPFISAISAAVPTSASSSGSLYDTAVKRWYSTNAERERAGQLGLRGSRNTRSHGTNTSSNTVSVSSILCLRRQRELERRRGRRRRRPTRRATGPGVSTGTANATA